MLDLQELSPEVDDPLLRVRGRWLEGKLELEQGRIAKALEILEAAREGFLARRLSFDAAVISLEIANAYRRLGRTAELRQLIGQVLPTFQLLQVGQDLFGALLMLLEGTSSPFPVCLAAGVGVVEPALGRRFT